MSESHEGKFVSVPVTQHGSASTTSVVIVMMIDCDD